jgi:hypothetical protein
MNRPPPDRTPLSKVLRAMVVVNMSVFGMDTGITPLP